MIKQKGFDVPTILFNAFSFLQKKLKEKNCPYSNVDINFSKGETVEDIVTRIGLKTDDIEAVFINGRIQSFDTILCDQDRVAIFPPGIPGPYRVLLGIVKKKR